MTSYRARALTYYPPICDICKADGEPLDAHHRDGNHQDDRIALEEYFDRHEKLKVLVPVRESLLAAAR